MNLQTFIDLRPAGGAQMIMADPPWSYEMRSKAGYAKSPDAHYQTMDIAAIKSLPVEALAAPDALLWLWAVGPMLPEALAVCAAWGFTFKTAGWWVKQTKNGKQTFGTGYDPGVGGDRVWLSAVLAFQKDHGVTVDGIIGRATLSTMQRRLDHRAKAMMPVGAIAVALMGGATGLTDQLVQVPQADTATLAVAGVWLFGHLWGHRDAIAGTIDPSFPRIAALLRSL